MIYVTERKVAGSLGLKLLPRSGAVQPELERPTHYFWLNPGFGCGTRRDVQRRLNKLGFDVHASGRFDDETRTVIKRWQAARGSPSTGFLNKAQHTALLSENLASRAPEEDDSAPSSSDDDHSSSHVRHHYSGGSSRHYYRGGGGGPGASSAA